MLRKRIGASALDLPKYTQFLHFIFTLHILRNQCHKLSDLYFNHSSLYYILLISLNIEQANIENTWIFSCAIAQAAAAKVAKCVRCAKKC